KSNKKRFALLTLERFKLFWIPRMRTPWQSLLELGISFAALAGLARLFLQRRIEARIFAGVMATYPLIYLFIQNTPRYRFPIEPSLYLLASEFAAGALAVGRGTGLRFSTRRLWRVTPVDLQI